MHGLTEEELEILKKIIKITEAKSKIYDKLCALEIANKKDTLEYKKLIENLKIATEFENDFYDSLNLNYSKCIIIDNYLSKDSDISYLSIGNEIIVCDNILERIRYRITRTLFNKYSTDYEHIDRKEISKLIGTFDEDDEEIDSYIYEETIEKIKSEDILNAFLVFLQDFIAEYNIFNATAKIIRNHLIESKYNAIFVNKNVEQEMISSNFDVSETLDPYSSFMTQLLEIDSNNQRKTRNLTELELFEEHIMNLLNISDIEHQNPIKIVSSILSQCLLKVSFLLMDDSTIDDAHILFEELKETSKDKLGRTTNGLSIKLIEKCFSEIQKDKERSCIHTY